MKRLFEKVRGNERMMELLRYGFFGAATTVVNVAVYQLLLLILDYRLSNLLAVLLSKLFAYVTNKRFVFHSRCRNVPELLREMLRFFLARGATGLLDYFGLIVAVDVFHLDPVWSKYGLQILVIVLNYILGKKTVFLAAPKGGEDPPGGDGE